MYRPAFTVGVLETHIVKRKALADGPWYLHAAGIGLYGRFNGEKIKQILQIQRTFGDAGKATHNALQHAVHPLKRPRQKRHGTDGDKARQGLEQNKYVGPVIRQGT